MAIGIAGITASLLIAGWLVISSLTDDHPSRAIKSRFTDAPPVAPARLPEIRLRDQYFRTVTTRQIRGRPALLAFVHPPCDKPCETASNALRAALDSVALEVPVYALSADAGRFTPAQGRRYLAEQRLDRMRLLFGSTDQLAVIKRAFSLTPHKGGSEHRPRLVLLDDRGVRRADYSLSEARTSLKHDISRLARSAFSVRSP